MTPRKGRALAAYAIVASLALAGCSGDDKVRTGSMGSGSPEDGPTSTETVEPPLTGEVPAPDAPLWDGSTAIARSKPRVDSLYPDVGQPLIDALHYSLGLSWSPETHLYQANEVLRFRATGNAPSFNLDLAENLAVSSVSVDGVTYEYSTAPGDQLTIKAPVSKNQVYVVQLAFSGTPEQTSVPVQRPDFNSTGFTITDTDEVWTMQEPWGAFTWYAANDHPSDKALYDFTLAVPSPMMGVANGDLTSEVDEDGVTTTTWQLDEPAATYLTTLAFGEFTQTDLVGPRDIPIRLFTPAGEPVPGDLERAPEALAWLENKIGPYPFDTAGVLVIDAESGMETQTMITLGNSEYATSMPVLVHEFAHHWYGDTVTPNDWRDVWMNEGMATYLQLVWEAEEAGISIEEELDLYAEYEGQERKSAGPPADFDPDKMLNSNVYFGPALMWDELRQKLGDKEFYRVTAAWPATHENKNASREKYFAWLEKETGEELTSFFDAWLLGEKTPSRD